jgi:hypothetical protein
MKNRVLPNNKHLSNNSADLRQFLDNICPFHEYFDRYDILFEC